MLLPIDYMRLIACIACAVVLEHAERIDSKIIDPNLPRNVDRVLKGAWQFLDPLG
jgi:hypothetical protein